MNSAYDLVIANGTVATASDVFKADVGIKDGTIVSIARELSDATRTVDASGKLVLPGGIDSHVHISQPSGPGVIMADDFESGTQTLLTRSAMRNSTTARTAHHMKGWM